MEEFNAYPTQTTRVYNPIPKETEKTLKEEISQTLEQLPVLKEVVKHLDEQIAFFDSVDSVTVDLKADPQAHLNEILANKLAKAKLQAERSYILTRVERAIKR